MVAVVFVIIGASYVISNMDVQESRSNDVTPPMEKYNIYLESSYGGSTTGAGVYNKGSNPHISAVPNEGYKFAGWYQNGKLYSESTRVQVSVNSDMSFKAMFEIQYYVITISKNNNFAGTVTNSTTGVYNSMIQLNANANAGYEFNGWYEGLTKISERSSSIYTVKKDAAIEAKFSIIHDASFTIFKSSDYAPSNITAASKYNVEIVEREWRMKDVLTGEQIYWSHSVGVSTYGGGINKGRAVEVSQSVTYSDGKVAASSQIVVIDEKVKKSFSWKYHENDWTTMFRDWLGIDHKNNRSAAFTWDLSFSAYYASISDTTSRYNNVSNISKFITPNNSYIISLAKYFGDQTAGWNDLQRANYVLKFVQSLPYEYDIDFKGVSDYWKFPFETLWDQKGDCEDHAFLYASIMKALGYKVAIFDIDCYKGGIITGRHFAPGVVLSNGTGTYYTVDNEKYYYCESTTLAGLSDKNWANVGYVPDGYRVTKIYKV